MTHLSPDHMATAGLHTLPGQAWRRGDPLKHLGPPWATDLASLSSPIFSTRCGLGPGDGPWRTTDDDDDVWCPGCLRQAGIPHQVEAM